MLFPKTFLTLAAAAAIGASALIPETASARPHGDRQVHAARAAVDAARPAVQVSRPAVQVARVSHRRAAVRHHVRPARVYVRHRHFVRHRPIVRVRVVRPVRYAVYNRCIVRHWVATPYGPRLRVVNRCYRPHYRVIYRR
jgi:hypothetical protein